MKTLVGRIAESEVQCPTANLTPSFKNYDSGTDLSKTSPL